MRPHPPIPCPVFFRSLAHPVTRYCTGTAGNSFSGNRDDPVEVNGKNLCAALVPPFRVSAEQNRYC